MMKKIDYIILALTSLSVLFLLTYFQGAPGYMDADYYYAGGINLVSGKGLVEPYLWNYLDNPVSLPHPAFTYWMPLTSMLAVLGMALTGSQNIFSARLLFLLFACVVPALTAALGASFSKSRVGGWISGGLAVFSGYYLAFMGTTDTFTISMLLGCALVFAIKSQSRSHLRHFILGLIAGLLHLSRADGMIWSIVIMVAIFLEANWKNKPGVLKQIGLVLCGYLLIMGIWYARNFYEFGNLFPPGGAKTLWLVDYNQLFSFPSNKLSFQSWVSASPKTLMHQRWEALVQNFRTLIAVQGQVVVLPLALIGAWKLRHLIIVRVGTASLVAIFLIMTIVFPEIGSRGGYFHSGAPMQPIIWALCPVGLTGVIEVGVRRRNWIFQRAIKGFGIILVITACFMSLGVTLNKLIDNQGGYNAWNIYWRDYQAIEDKLVESGLNAETRVMVNNPPGYYAATGRWAIMIPDGGENAVIDAARIFNTQILILDENRPEGLNYLFDNRADQPAFQFLFRLNNSVVYRIKP